MRAVTKTLVLAGAALAIASCRDNQAEQNITVTDNIPANADIEALPADESSATPTDQLENGIDTPAANDTVNTTNTY